MTTKSISNCTRMINDPSYVCPLYRASTTLLSGHLNMGDMELRSKTIRPSGLGGVFLLLLLVL